MLVYYFFNFFFYFSVFIFVIIFGRFFLILFFIVFFLNGYWLYLVSSLFVWLNVFFFVLCFSVFSVFFSMFVVYVVYIIVIVFRYLNFSFFGSYCELFSIIVCCVNMLCICLWIFFLVFLFMMGWVVMLNSKKLCFLVWRMFLFMRFLVSCLWICLSW